MDGHEKGDMHFVFKAPAPFSPLGGDEGDRTPGLGVANAALSQLSYIPILFFKRRGKRIPPPISRGSI